MSVLAQEAAMLAMAGPEDDARSTRAAVKLVSGAVRPAPASHAEHMRYTDGQASHIDKQKPRCGCGMAPGDALGGLAQLALH